MTTSHRVLDPGTPWDSATDRCALGIMTKAPLAGEVKTRLVPPLTLSEAAELNACFLRDLGSTLASCCSGGLQPSEKCNVMGVGIYAPLGAEGIYDDILPPGFVLIPQRGKSFGERLIFAAEDLFQVGYASVCLINSDSPTVPSASFAEAVEKLEKPGDRVVLGPSEDGGYYLIGLKRMYRRLFEEIDWSTERVLAQTKQRAAEIGLKVHELPPGSDVDDKAALQQLCAELLDQNAGPDVAPETKQFLSEIVGREGRDRIWPVNKL